jgi:hypothetical protein
MPNPVPAINDYKAADECADNLGLIWALMISGPTTLVPRRSDECLELYRWLYEAHQNAVALNMFLFKQRVLDVEKMQKARHYVSAFSALLETQYPFLVTKYKSMLSNAELLEVLNAKMAVQYAAQILGPDPVESIVHVMA